MATSLAMTHSQCSPHHGTGSTSQYYEPAPAIPLNNAAAMLSAKEAELETAVLLALSQLLMSRAAQIRALVASVAALDVAAARAAHARLFGGVEPALVELPRTSHSHDDGHTQGGGQPIGASHGHAGGNTLEPCGDPLQSLMSIPGAHHPLLLERSLASPLPDPPSVR
jgi:hypothetical protein